MKLSALSIAIGLLLAGSAFAAGTCGTPDCCEPEQVCGTPDCCGHCGRRSVCDKVCRVVCEMKEVKKTVWTVETEEFCVPMPNCGHGCQQGCGSCGSCDAGGCGEESCTTCGCDPCESLRNRKVVPPRCGPVRCRKKLVKKEITCEVPTYKCVVEFCCPGCDSGCGEEEAAPAATPQESPAPATTLIAPLPPLVSGVGYLKQLD